MKEIEQAEEDHEYGWGGGWKRAVVFKRAVGICLLIKSDIWSIFF